MYFYGFSEAKALSLHVCACVCIQTHRGSDVCFYGFSEI